MSDSTETEGEPELGISPAAVAAIIDLARRIDELEEDAELDGDDEPDDEDEDGERDDPEELAESLDERIESLGEEEQAALLALAWVGRGDHEPEEWPEALRLARERNRDGDAAAQLRGMEMLGDLLSEGLAAFGISAEEIERP